MKELLLEIEKEIGYAIPENAVYTKSEKSLKVSVVNGNITVEYANIRDIARAALILKANGVESDYVIEEQSVFKDVCLMLDCSRNAVKNIETVKKLIRNLALTGYTSLMLYTEDTYEVEGEPAFGYLRGRYTQDEIKEMDAYAKLLGLELIPCIQTLAHLNQLMRYKYTHFNCFDCSDILLVGAERTYTLIENMFRTLSKCYSSKKIHIGMDEAWLLGRGKYLNQNGFVPRFDILCSHLEKVYGLAKKYGFTPIMWSDMFWRTAYEDKNCRDENGNVKIPEEVLKKIPQDVVLCHWDYHYCKVEDYLEKLQIHKQFQNPVWFAGGTVECIRGVIPHVTYSLKVAKAAIAAAKQVGVESVMQTVWGDNGGEASLFANLPAITYYAYTARDIAKERLEKEFFALSGYYLKEYMRLEEGQTFGKYTEDMGNPTKYGLYNDVFLGYIDAVIRAEDKKYFSSAKKAVELLKQGQYAYVFDTVYDLNSVLEIKYDIGIRLRKAYSSRNKDELMDCANDLQSIIARLDKFIKTYRKQWFQENKPHGLEVQEIRLGGLKERLVGCKERVIAYVNGELAEIPELEEKLLEQVVTRTLAGNRADLFSYEAIASVNAFDGYTEVDV